MSVVIELIENNDGVHTVCVSGRVRIAPHRTQCEPAFTPERNCLKFGQVFAQYSSYSSMISVKRYSDGTIRYEI